MGREALLETIVEGVRNPDLHVRLGNGLIFLREESFHYIARLYLEGQGIESLSREQLKDSQHELIEMCRGGLHYLVEGANCLSGRFLSIKTTEHKTLSARLPVTDSQPIPCRDYLHPKDPFFRNNRAIELYPSPNYVARIKIGRKEYLVSIKTFESFMIQARASRRTRKFFHTRLSAQRKCLQTLTTLLKSLMHVRAREYCPRIIEREYGYSSKTKLPWYFQITNEGVVTKVLYDSSYKPVRRSEIRRY